MLGSINRLRGLFAICVMFGHAMDFATEYAGAYHLGDGVENIISPLRGFFGFLWVVGFIVVSGFCIARSCEVAKEQFSFRSFTVMRVTRIYPLLILCTLLALIVELPAYLTSYHSDVWRSGLDARTFILTLLGVSGFQQAFGSLAPSYTISFELLYYLIWGCVWAAFLSRIAAIWSALTIGILLVLVSDGIFRFAAMLMAVWLVGAATWLFRAVLIEKAQKIPAIFGWLLIFAVSGAIAVRQGNGYGHPDLYVVSVNSLAEFIALAIAFSLLIILSAAKQENEHEAWFDHALGEISYPLFLAHGPLLMLFCVFAEWGDLQLHYSLYLTLSCACAFAGAYGIALFVERPVMAWRKNIRALNPDQSGAPEVMTQASPD